jgi:hypothetical protein
MLPPFSHLGQPNMEMAAAKSKEDGCSGRHLSCIGGRFVHKLLAASGLHVNKALAMGGLLAFVGGTLVKEVLGSMLVKKVLAMSSLLFFVSGAC